MIDITLRTIRRRLKNYPVTKKSILATKKAYNKWDKWCKTEIFDWYCALCANYWCEGCPLDIISSCFEYHSLFELADEELAVSTPGIHSRRLRDCLGRILKVLEENYSKK